MLFRPNVAKLASRGDSSGLVKVLAHRDPKLRAAAAEALGELGGFEAVTSLLWTSLTDQDERVWRASAAAFRLVGELKDVQEQGFFFAEGDDDSWVTHFHVHKDRPPKLEWAGVGIETLLRLEAIGVEVIREGLLDRDWRVRESAASLLDSVGAEPAETDLLGWYLLGLREWGRLQALGAGAIEPLVAALGHPQQVVRHNAAKRLYQFGLTAVPALSSVILGNAPEPQISAAIAALEEIATSERLQGHPDPVPKAAREGLSRHHVARLAAMERALREEAKQAGLL